MKIVLALMIFGLSISGAARSQAASYGMDSHEFTHCLLPILSSRYGVTVADLQNNPTVDIFSLPDPQNWRNHTPYCNGEMEDVWRTIRDGYYDVQGCQMSWMPPGTFEKFAGTPSGKVLCGPDQTCARPSLACVASSIAYGRKHP
jgi:hypothetical protein